MSSATSLEPSTARERGWRIGLAYIPRAPLARHPHPPWRVTRLPPRILHPTHVPHADFPFETYKLTYKMASFVSNHTVQFKMLDERPPPIYASDMPDVRMKQI